MAQSIVGTFVLGDETQKARKFFVFFKVVVTKVNTFALSHKPTNTSVFVTSSSVRLTCRSSRLPPNSPILPFPRPQVSTEVTGTVSEALVGFRLQCMEHLSAYMGAKSGAGAKAEANVDAFADDEEVEVEEDNVDKFLKGKNKKQKR